MRNTITRVQASSHAPSNSGSYNRVLFTVASLFFAWGFLTSLNNVLIPYLQSILALSYRKAMLVQSSFFGAALLFALPTARLVEKIGHKKTIIVGLLIMGAGSLLFRPASERTSFEFFLAALMIVSVGITALQVAAGPYVTRLGPSQEAASRMNLALGLNSLGAMLALPFGSRFILAGNPVMQAAFESGRIGDLRSHSFLETSAIGRAYFGIALALAALAALIVRIRLPEFTSPRHSSSKQSTHPALPVEAWRYLLLSAVVMFLYVGAEVTIGSFLIDYLHQPQIGAMTYERAASYVSLYWGGSMVGRLAGWVALRNLNSRRALAFASLAAFSLVVCTLVGSGLVATSSIIMVGLCNSIMVPCIFTLAIAGLGSHTERGAGVMVAAVAGGAVIPPAQGALADGWGIHRSFILPALCYLCISAYGFFARPPSTIAPVRYPPDP